MGFHQESYTGKINRMLAAKQRLVSVAAGREPADLVLRNAAYENRQAFLLQSMIWAAGRDNGCAIASIA